MSSTTLDQFLKSLTPYQLEALGAHFTAAAQHLKLARMLEDEGKVNGRAYEKHAIEYLFHIDAVHDHLGAMK